MLTGCVIRIGAGHAFVRTNDCIWYYAHWTDFLGGRRIFAQLRLGDLVAFDSTDPHPTRGFPPLQTKQPRPKLPCPRARNLQLRPTLSQAQRKERAAS
jgi:hypothetical protein